MSYLHIKNLYADQDILMFKEVYASEKIHGTSAHVSWKDSKVSFFSGGVEHLGFLNLFNEDDLSERFIDLGVDEIIIFGEAYGGKCQGMSATYGKELRFVAFEVKIGKTWLSQPDSEGIANSLGLDFVSYEKCSTDIEELDRQRDLPSAQSVKCGIDGPKKREGVVLRPLIEVTKNNGKRIIAKHKADDFMETKTPRKVTEEDLKILKQANDIAEEWVTVNRLNNIVSHLPSDLDVTKTGNYIKIMIEDVRREGGEEVIMSKAAEKAIGKKTAQLIKLTLQGKLNETMLS